MSNLNDDVILENLFDIMQTYQQNVRNILTIYDQMFLNIQSSLYRRRTPYSRYSSNVRRNLFPATSPPTRRPYSRNSSVNIWRNRSNPLDLSNLEDVLIIPTRQQIDAATERIQYNSSNISQESDPIDLQPFTENEYIIRLRNCGHCFREVNLEQWFQNSVRCPLCRNDIREIHTSNN